MEDYFYIILLIIWVVMSLLRRSSKARAKAAQSKAQPDATTSLPKGSELEELIGEFFGEGKKKQQEAPAEVFVEEYEELPGYLEELPGRTIPAGYEKQAGPDSDYQPWMSEEQKAYYEQREPIPQLESSMPEYTGFFDTVKTGSESFSAIESVASVDELIRSHAAIDAMEQARAEMEYGDKRAGEGMPEFDLRKAVIFSEILNRKYS